MIFREKLSPVNVVKVLCMACLVVVTGCCSNGPEINEPLLTGYQAISHPVKSEKISTDVDCYLDFSDGMKSKTSFSQEYYLNLYNEISLLPSVHFYKVGEPDTPQEIAASEANFRTGLQYTDKLSKLRSTLERIVKNMNDVSIFITDFEQITLLLANQYPAPLNYISENAWGHSYFKDWFIAGNRLDVFATECKLISGPAKGVQNWVYTLVFTPCSVMDDEEAYDKSLVKKLIEKMPPSIRHFSYSASDFKIEQHGQSEDICNANDDVVVTECLAQTHDKHFEYYRFTSNDLITFNTDDAFKNDRRIINKIKVVNNNEAYANVEFDIKTYDITASLNDYASSLENEEPEVVENIETGQKSLKHSKPQVKYSYKPGQEVTDVFDFVFNAENKQAGIKLKPDFSGTSENTVYQVDIIARQIALKKFDEEDTVLVLKYSTPVQTFKPLRESIYLAIRDAAKEVEGKPLYTIYIRIDK